MAVCADAACGANGIYQLPDAIAAGGIVLLWNRLWHVWQTAAVRDLLCGGCDLGPADHLEPYLAAVFPLWPARMGLALPYLLEKAAIQEK